MLSLHEFVVAENLFENNNEMYDTCSKKADDFMKTMTDQKEIIKTKSFLNEINSQWNTIATEIRSVQPKLNEAIDSWRRYTAGVNTLTIWLNGGERIMSQSPGEKQVHCSLHVPLVNVQFLSNMSLYHYATS